MDEWTMDDDGRSLVRVVGVAGFGFARFSLSGIGTRRDERLKMK